MFPTIEGNKCTKEAMTGTIEKAAFLLKVPLTSPDGTERVSGHSLRVTGAQGMAKLGLDLWAVQLLGRWGSNTVLQYVRLAHLEAAEGWARRAASNMPLEDVVKELVSLQPVERPAAVVKKSMVRTAAAQTELEEALRHEVLVEELREEEKLSVVMGDSGVAHSVLLGPPETDLHSSRTVCGWRFGRSGAALRRRSDLPSSYKALCQKCFPETREALKVELSVAARRLGEGVDPGPAARACQSTF